MMKKFIAILLMAFIILFNNSCKKNNSEIDYNPNVNSSKNLVFSENYMREIMNIFFMSINDPALKTEHTVYINNCNIYYNENQNLLRFDYADDYRSCANDIFRKGYYLAQLDGPLNEAGTIYTFDFDQDSTFFRIGTSPQEVHHISADITATEKGLNVENKAEYEWNISNCVITKTSDTTLYYYSTDYLLTWEMGAGTPGIVEDDVLSITGSASGTTDDNIPYTANVLTELIDYMDCSWFAEGVHEIIIPSGSTTNGTVDYIMNDNCKDSVNYFFDDNLFYDQIR